MTSLYAPYFHLSKSQKPLLELVKDWKTSLLESEKELSFLETYIASPIFYITPELLSEFIIFEKDIKMLIIRVRELLAITNKHISVIKEWNAVEELVFEDFILNEHSKLESNLIEFIANYNQIKLKVFNYTKDKLIQKPEN